MGPSPPGAGPSQGGRFLATLNPAGSPPGRPVLWGGRGLRRGRPVRLPVAAGGCPLLTCRVSPRPDPRVWSPTTSAAPTPCCLPQVTPSWTVRRPGLVGTRGLPGAAVEQGLHGSHLCGKQAPVSVSTTAFCHLKWQWTELGPERQKRVGVEGQGHQVRMYGWQQGRG